ncbi:hypothetical protein [Streptomyces parvus]|uniref:hypothetical protein n=1 Tax=Streptomyces parvus TaxID=66428 RepID=UPI003814DEFB
MSIHSLLRHVGIDVPRYITVNGRVIFDTPASPAAGAAVAAATRVEPHRFHAGPDPAPARGKHDNAWWNVDASARQRDIEAMSKAFPGFILFEEDDDFWYGGTIDTGRGKFLIAVLPQTNRSLPTIRLVSKFKLGRQEGRYWRRSPHLYDSGALCVAAVDDWNSEVHTTATATAWAAHWLAAYTEWRVSGVWPTEGYGRNAA